MNLWEIARDVGVVATGIITGSLGGLGVYRFKVAKAQQVRAEAQSIVIDDLTAEIDRLKTQREEDQAENRADIDDLKQRHDQAVGALARQNTQQEGQIAHQAQQMARQDGQIIELGRAHQECEGKHAALEKKVAELELKIKA